ALENNPDFLKANSTQRRSPGQTVLRMVGLSQPDKPVPTGRPKDELPLRAAVAPSTNGEDLSEAKRLSPFVGAILAGLKVDPVKETRGYFKETRLIDIAFTHTDPEVAAT